MELPREEELDVPLIEDDELPRDGVPDDVPIEPRDEEPDEPLMDDDELPREDEVLLPRMLLEDELPRTEELLPVRTLLLEEEPREDDEEYLEELEPYLYELFGFELGR